jgi:hypothetical protein
MPQAEVVAGAVAPRAAFNAALSLGDWDPSAERTGSYDNVLEDGKEYLCFPTEGGEQKEWTKGVMSDMVELDNGRRAHAHYIASCMVDEGTEGLLLNMGKDVKFHCAHTPRTAKEEGLALHCMKDFVSEEVRGGAFPRFRAKITLPVAVAVVDLNSAPEATKLSYSEYFGGMSWEDITKDPEVKYLPSVKRASTGTHKGQLFNSKRTIVEITDAEAKLVVKPVVA